MDDKQILIGKLIVRDAQIERAQQIIARLHLQIAVLSAFAPGFPPCG